METTGIIPWDKGILTRPRAGLFQCTMEEYGRIPAVSRTILHELHSKTPAHALLKMQGEDDSTEAKDFGTAFHTAILEPPKLRDVVVAQDGVTRKQKGWKDLAAQYEGRTLITQPESVTLVAMRRRLMAEPGIKRLLESPLRELACVWQDPESHYWLKARIDILDRKNPPFILDLKTARDASPKAMAYSARDYGYTMQAGMYTDGVNAVLGTEIKGFVIVAIEKEPPYRLEWYDMRRHVDAGRAAYKAALATYVACDKAGFWPAMNRHPLATPTVHELPLYEQ